jgi:DNA helicase-2/ATP-dependent DNA helicase PcrA
MGWDVASVSLGELAAGVDRCRLLADLDAADPDPLAPLARAYEERLRRHGAIDFVAMLALPLRLFLSDEQTLRVLQDGYAQVLVDEVQDLDPTEWRLVELLSERHGNLLVAGDDRQCLYVWRGADPNALKHFVERHPLAPVVTLDQNYRSTNRLVQVANAVADLFEDPRALWTDNPEGAQARLKLADDEHAEARNVAEQIASLLDRGLLPHPGQASVIFRTRAQADVVAAALRELALPYRLHGHADLFGTRVVRDCLAYLRLSVNPTDRAALMRVVNLPPRGLSTLAPALVEEPATLEQLPSRAAECGPAAVAAAAGLMSVVYDLHAHHTRGLQPAALLDRAVDCSGLRLWLEHHPDGTQRLRLLGRLRTVLLHLDVSLAEWLDGIALGEDLARVDEEAVRLSSVHSAKGHEWRATWVIGVEEGLMPHYRAVAASKADPDSVALDEELRALYVALTRPRERLYVSACLQRTRGDRTEVRVPSRWLHALGPELLAVA